MKGKGGLEKKATLKNLFIQRSLHLKKVIHFFATYNKTKQERIKQLKEVILWFNGLVPLQVSKKFYYSFVSNRLTIDQKLLILLNHYSFIKTNFTKDSIERLFTTGIPCYTASTNSGLFYILLQVTRPLDFKDGCLTLIASLESKKLCVMSFTIAPGVVRNSNDDFIVVSRIQTIIKNHNEVKTLNKEFFDIIASKLLLHALEGICQGLGINYIVSIRAKEHVEFINIADKLSYENSYDGFWKQLYEFQEDPLGYQVSLPIKFKPLLEVTQKHRKRAANKQAKLKEISTSSCTAIKKMLIGSDEA
jgi:uncharacterized protein VirK/YbjX